MSTPAPRIHSPRSAVPAKEPVPLWIMMVIFGLIGFNSKLSFGAVPPVMPEIRAQLGLSGLVLGLLTAIPTVFMGLSAPPAQILSVRIGAEWTVALSLGLMSLAEATRLFGSNESVLFLSSVGVGAGMGGAATLIPSLIGHHVMRSRGLTTGIYSMMVAGGTGSSAYLAVPLADALGSWERSIASWAVPAALTGAAWAALIPRLLRADASRTALAGKAANPSGTISAETTRSRPSGPGLPWGSATARWVTTYVSLQSLVAFSGVAWIVPQFREIGWSASEAAGLMVLFQAAQAVSMLSLPYLCDRFRDRRPVLAASGICTLTGVFSLAIAPTTTAIPATILFGIGLGGGFSLAFVLLVDCTSTKEDAARLSAMVFLIGYLVAATGPLVVGLTHDLTGGFKLGYLVLSAVAVVNLALVFVLRPGRSLDEDERLGLMRLP
ncbi:MAG: major facilitator superfamily 1 [Pseudonocardiales bacterium]|nr:major facilitator superfamily 1 [Pseudonocardiales bacterium]